MSETPEHAASIWFEGNEICLLLPPSNHIVRLPIEKCGIHLNVGGTPKSYQTGWYMILDILRERYHEKNAKKRVIATRPAPTSYNLETIKNYMKFTKPKQAKPELTLEDLFE